MESVRSPISDDNTSVNNDEEISVLPDVEQSKNNNEDLNIFQQRLDKIENTHMSFV